MRRFVPEKIAGRPLRYLLVGLSAGVLAVSVLLALEIARRRALYWYDVKADYRYAFTGAGVQHFRVRLADGGFTFPDAGRRWDTAVLRLSMRGTAASVWFEPAIRVGAPGQPGCTQSFERGAAGVRYLDLCLDTGRLKPGTRISVSGRSARIGDQEAELLLFQSPLRADSRILVLAPHADDAEIAAFGLFSHRDSWIVTTTNGSYGGHAYAALLQSPRGLDSLQAELRAWNSEASAIWAGLPTQRAINLGYFTLALEPMHADPDRMVPNPVTGSTDMTRWRRIPLASLATRPARPTWNSFVGDLVALLQAIHPDVVVMPHPALDANRDHVFTAVAMLEALQRLGDPPLQLLLYTNHHVLSEYYPYGSTETVAALPPWFDPCVPFDGVLSYRLTPQARLAKLFALEAMHDLRRPPWLHWEGPVQQAFHNLDSGVRGFVRDPFNELSYFRRAARYSELFFTYSSKDRERLQRLAVPAAGRGAACGPAVSHATPRETNGVVR